MPGALRLLLNQKQLFSLGQGSQPVLMMRVQGRQNHPALVGREKSEAEEPRDPESHKANENQRPRKEPQ